MEDIKMNVIAKIYNDFPEKFGIPRQSGLLEEIKSEIVFEKDYRDENSLRGIEEFSHLWLIWLFSENTHKGWSPTVRPPRLGGNKRVGVFATRSPFRPNPIGISCVKLIEVKKTPDKGTVLIISGADLLDGTPILDIKPYLSFTDSKPDANSGFADKVYGDALKVVIPAQIKEEFPEIDFVSLEKILSQDPRPHYQHDKNRVYGMKYANFDIFFRVEDSTVFVESLKS